MQNEPNFQLRRRLTFVAPAAVSAVVVLVAVLSVSRLGPGTFLSEARRRPPFAAPPSQADLSSGLTDATVSTEEKESPEEDAEDPRTPPTPKTASASSESNPQLQPTSMATIETKGSGRILDGAELEQKLWPAREDGVDADRGEMDEIQVEERNLGKESNTPDESIVPEPIIDSHWQSNELTEPIEGMAMVEDEAD